MHEGDPFLGSIEAQGVASFFEENWSSEASLVIRG
jgi:hypothetical protein